MTTTPPPGPAAPGQQPEQPEHQAWQQAAPETAQQTAEQMAQQAPQQAAPERPAKQRRTWSKGRLALLMTCAAVLGVAGGGGIGYAIQAQRPPTPLPPLAGAALHYPLVHASTAPAPLPADQDDAVRTDGDLTALLMPAPSGSRPWEQSNTPDGWLSAPAFALGYQHPDGEFRWLLQNGFRRAAEKDWTQGGNSYSVVLLQFQKQDESNIAQALSAHRSDAQSFCGGSTVSVPGTANGAVYGGTTSHTDAGGNSYYGGRGFARHGDLIVEVYVNGGSQIPAQSVLSVLQSQLERL